MARGFLHLVTVVDPTAFDPVSVDRKGQDVPAPARPRFDVAPLEL